MRQEVYFENIREQIIKHIKEAKYDIKIAVAWFTDERIIDALLVKKKMTRVKISIIIYDDEINKLGYYNVLHLNNVNIYRSQKMMHNKFCIIDNEIIINGSFNWTKNASRNKENIQVTFSNKILIDQFHREYIKLKAGSLPFENFIQSSDNEITKLDYEFEKSFKDILNTYEFPFIYDAREVNFSNANLNNKTPKKLYYIGYEDAARNILKRFYILQNNHSTEIYYIKIGQKQDVIDSLYFSKYVENMIYDDIINNTKDKNQIIPINKNGVQTIIFNNNEPKSGKILNIYKNKKNTLLYFGIRINASTFLGSPNTNKKTKVYNSENGTEKDFKYYLTDFYKNNNFVFKEDDKYGICDLNENVIFPPVLSETFFTETGINSKYLILIERPVIITRQKDSYVKNIYYVNNHQTSSGIYKKHFYDLESKKVVETRVIAEKNYDKFPIYGSYYLSDEDFKNKDFFKFILTFTFKTPFRYATKTGHYDFTSRATYEEFSKLKSNINNLDPLLTIMESERAKIYTKTKNKKKDDPCYIATMVYGDYDHTEVLFLRDFRDTVLSKSDYGQKFIKWYYKNSPQFVNYVKDKPILNSLTSGFIYTLVFLLKILQKK